MGKRTAKSIKGEEVDFDLLETKQKIEENKPRVLEVRQREDFVHTKRKSRGRKAVMDRIRKKKEKAPTDSEPKKNTLNTTTKETESKNTSTGKKKTTSKKRGKRKIVKK